MPKQGGHWDGSYDVPDIYEVGYEVEMMSDENPPLKVLLSRRKD